MEEKAGEILRYLQWPLVVLVTGMVLGFIGRSRAQKRAGADSGLMQYPAMVMWLGIVCVAVFVSFAVLSQVFPGVDQNGVELEKGNPLVGLFFLAFSGLGLFLVYIYFFERHFAGPDELRYNTLTKKGSVLWRDIGMVDYSKVYKWFSLKDSSGRAIHISAILSGLPEFTNLILKNVPAEKIMPEAKKVLDDITQGKLPEI